MNNEINKEKIKILTDCVIHSIREFASQGKEFSANALFESFCNDEEIKKIFDNKKDLNETEEISHFEKENQKLKNTIEKINKQIETLQNQKVRMDKQLTEMESGDSLIVDVYKRSLLIFMSMLRTSENEAYFETLDLLKKQIAGNIDIKEMDRLLAKLQKIALWEEESFESGNVTRKEDYKKIIETNETLKKQLERAISQRDKFEKNLSQLEDQFEEKEGFYKRVLILFMSMLKTHENKMYFGIFDRFKKLLSQQSSVDRMSKVIDTLQNVSLLEEKDEQPVENIELSKEEKDDLLVHVKECFTEILNEFQVNLNEEYFQRVSNLQQKLFESFSAFDIFSFKEEIVQLAQLYTENFHKEAEKASKYMEEISCKLVEMESHIETSLDDSRKAHQANEQFNRKLEEQMDNIKGSVRFTKSLSDLKKMVVSSMKRIKISLDKKNQDSEILIGNADENLAKFKDRLASMKKEVSLVQNKSRYLERELNTDPITGIYNRRSYEKKILEELQKSKTTKESFSLLAFDVNNFRGIINKFGHSAGDECLKFIAKRVKKYIRPNDFFARYTSDEFVVLLPNTEDTEACEAGEYLEEIIRKMRFIFKGRHIPLTISVGVTQWYSSDKNTESIFNRVHKAMFEAKKQRNRRVVCCRQSNL